MNPIPLVVPLPLAFLVLSVTAQTPVQYGANFYEFVPAAITWQSSLTAAGNRVFGGVRGHLATTTSAGENAFLASLVTYPSPSGGWCAGRVDGTGVGRWMAGPETGQPFASGQTAAPGAYANWGGIEPNNAPSFLWMNLGPGFAGIATGQWADDDDGVPSGSDPVVGYFVEYEAPRWWPVGIGCAGPAGAPAMVAVTAPDLGTTFRLAVTNMPGTGGLFAMVIGLSDTLLPGLGPLPYSLAAYGAPGCFAYCELVSTVVAFQTAGTGVYDLSIPARPELAGLPFFQQAYVFDAPANPLGITTSNGGRARVQ